MILLVGVQICGTAPRSLTHTHKYIYTCISSSLNHLLKSIYVTGWLDPKSCVSVFVNKILPVPPRPCYLNLHKLMLCLAKYRIVLVTFRIELYSVPRCCLRSQMVPLPFGYPCVQVPLGCLMHAQGVPVDLCSTFASETACIAVFLNWRFISDLCTPINGI